MKLKEIAARIAAHLKRFENDPAINVTPEGRAMSILPYWHSNAWSSGNRVFIAYVSFQHTSSLTKSEALAYLEKLDNGFVGRHFNVPKESQST